ncbi:type II toxin-antitoxin system RelE/ParE family toxin [Lacibacter luteus]|uniref:Type II toxin-antitoxin system RelE/ParE family toxin n=1 Tax=Lacibacter luteus TaxID=2508719 RepID=A0A4Q1CHL0_9BACT|nr:type II toxin-antitoxin system RelE/ParE family toxin [Lacibacter luteus]RXK59691.1 type II toxin-antitoxin system RelE/ParE family toxin [Lacibacter luteus]
MASKPKEIIVSPLAAKDLDELYHYLQSEFEQIAVEKFNKKWISFLAVIATHPRLFPILNKQKNLRKYAIHPKTLIVYKPSVRAIEIVTVFNNRQNPKNLKLLISRKK